MYEFFLHFKKDNTYRSYASIHTKLRLLEAQGKIEFINEIDRGKFKMRKLIKLKGE